jgi:hypothetical protein
MCTRARKESPAWYISPGTPCIKDLGGSTSSQIRSLSFPQELLSMCTRARREYIHVRYPQGLLSIYQRVWREYILLSPFVRYSQGLLSIYPRVRREYISFSDKVNLNSPGTPFYMCTRSRREYSPVRYPLGLLSI